jgi:tRNA(Ile)-lysidine synthetase-like protein
MLACRVSGHAVFENMVPEAVLPDSQVPEAPPYYTLMSDDALTSAIALVPAGAWAVGVSGGADSVALFMLLRRRPDLSPHIIHLDHQTRGADSTADADFVRDLAGKSSVPATIALRSEIERAMAELPANTSSRYRAVRIALFRKVVSEHALAGVVLAHHADDQAETVLQRLLRGSGPMGLAGMERAADLGGLAMVRPLLGIRRDALREFLKRIGQPWREDASNASDKYLRNRLRRLLAEKTTLFDPLLELAAACHALRDCVKQSSPILGKTFSAPQLADLPSLLATESARRWLTDRGVPPEQISPAIVARIVTMAADAGSASRAHFPGGVLVRRKGGMIGNSESSQHLVDDLP